MENYKKCLEIIAKQYPSVQKKDIDTLYQKWEESPLVETYELEEGCTIQLYQKDNRLWQLNSSCNPKKAAMDWAKQFDRPEINEHAIFLIFGMGDGRAIKELSEIKPKCNIIVYEPSIDIFFEAIHRSEWSELLEKTNIHLLASGINEEYYFPVLQSMVDYTNVFSLPLGILPNYTRLFWKQYEEFCNVNDMIINTVRFTRNTEVARTEEMKKNLYGILSDILEQYSVTQLFDCTDKMNWKDVPAVLIAAGPSLDKSLEELKQYRKQAFYLAVDTALNTLLENDIIPDLTISVDSRKPLTLFKNEGFDHIPIVFSQQSRLEVVHKNKSLHFYEIEKYTYPYKIVKEECNKEYHNLATGGSVANDALSLLIEMGFEEILLVGQDLAYPNLRVHTKNAYDEIEHIDVCDEKYIMVNDVNGNQIYTERNMDMYRKWIEKCVAVYADRTIINTSEIGAYIKGTKKQSLKDYFNKKNARDIDISKLWETISPFLTEEEVIRLRKRTQEVPTRISKIEKMVNEVISLYESMEALYDEKNWKQITRTLKEASLLTEQIEEMAETLLVQPYMMEKQYEIKGKIFQYLETDNLAKQILDMAEYGKDLMYSYREGIQKLKTEYSLFVPDYK